VAKRSTAKDAKRNARLAWLAQNICKGQTDAKIVIGLMAAFPGTSEKTARVELREIYSRFSEINAENMPEQKVKLMELAFDLLEQCRQNMQLGPAVNQFKTIAQMSGVITDKVQVDQSSSGGTPAPKADVVRDRISKLANDPKIRERAKKLGLDIDDVES
jgi:hypothetical protein